MSYTLIDNSIMTGSFSLIVRDLQGNIIEQYSDHNTITTNAKEAMALLVSQGVDANEKVIKFLGVGTDSDPATPSDDKLTNPYFVDLITYDYPEPGSVRFRFQLSTDDANGMPITEYGLMCKDYTLFARKVRKVITKNADLVFEISWTIRF